MFKPKTKKDLALISDSLKQVRNDENDQVLKTNKISHINEQDLKHFKESLSSKMLSL